MTTDAILLISYILLALGLSFLCSVAEATLLSITPAFVEELRTTHAKRAARLQRLRLDQVDRSLAAILTLNTIAHTVGAIGAGVQAEHVFGSTWLGLFSGLMTLAILFLSEIVPKTLGALYWPALVWPTALFVQLLMLTLFPFVWLSERLTRLIARGKPMHSVSRSELAAMARVGEKSGHIGVHESRIIHNLLRLNAMTARDIMTPRTVVTTLPEQLSVHEALERIVGLPFSRLPLHRSGIDEITGFVLRDEVLRFKSAGRQLEPLSALKRDLLAVPESASLPQLLERLLRDRQHITLVVDEYGSTQGLVTLEDLIETLLGMEIVDELDKVADMQALARKLWTDRAQALGLDPTLGGDQEQ